MLTHDVAAARRTARSNVFSSILHQPHPSPTLPISLLRTSTSVILFRPGRPPSCGPTDHHAHSLKSLQMTMLPRETKSPGRTPKHHATCVNSSSPRIRVTPLLLCDPAVLIIAEHQPLKSLSAPRPLYLTLLLLRPVSHFHTRLRTGLYLPGRTLIVRHTRTSPLILSPHGLRRQLHPQVPVSTP